MNTLRIITIDSPGLLNDAEIYSKVFKKNNFTVEIYIIDDEIENKIKSNYEFKNKTVHLNLFLESIQPRKPEIPEYNLKTVFPAKINLFMPNQELFYGFNELKYIDYILCKTNVAYDFFSAIQKEHDFKYKCIYTKFTTYIPKEFKEIEIKKNPNIFVHLAGKSPFKNTSYLLYCWLKNKGFSYIDKDIELHVTCYDACFRKLLGDLRKKFNFNLHYDKNKSFVKINNVYFYFSKIPLETYKNLLVNANVAICPSYQEGYGHYINEARYFQTFIITLDAPPMNELVIDGTNGICIKDLELEPKFNPKEYTKFELVKAFPKLDKLKEAIVYCINNKLDLREKGEMGKKLYIKDKKYFKKKMTKFIKKINDLLN